MMRMPSPSLRGSISPTGLPAVDDDREPVQQHQADEPFPLELSSRSDARLGIRETFVHPRLGGIRSIGVLAEPQGRCGNIVWVVVPSFGMEQMYLQPLEVAAARRLAALGFPVLRYHGRGYGDSSVAPQEVDFGAHLSDTLDAIREALGRTGIARAGLIGARVGAAVAVLASQRVAVCAMALWDPITSGSSYLAATFRALMAEELAGGQRDTDTPREPAEALERRGLLEIQGNFPLTQASARGLESLDVVREVTGPVPDVLLVQVSRGPTPQVGLARLRDRLRMLGSRTTVEVVTDREAPLFGQQRFRSSGTGSKSDGQVALTAELVAATERWVAASFGETAARESAG
jgi:pimeloyl-ACP methyl ester carboxylesterase